MASPLERPFTPVQNPYTDPSIMESETDKFFSQSTLQQSAQKHLSSNDAAIMQREREINDIARGIIELADIFKELQNLVIDQGTMLDRIDYNVEKMAVNVKAAEKELTVVYLHESICRIRKRADMHSIRLPAISVRQPNGKSYYFFCFLSLACLFSFLSSRSILRLLHHHQYLQVPLHFLCGIT